MEIVRVCTICNVDSVENDWILSTSMDKTSKLSGLGSLLAGIASLMATKIPPPLEPRSLRNIEPADKISLLEIELLNHNSVTLILSHNQRSIQKIEIG